MNKKFTLTLILAVVLISVIAFSACGVALAEEAGAWDKLNEKPDLYPSYPRLDAEATTPGFSGYVTASDVKVNDGLFFGESAFLSFFAVFVSPSYSIDEMSRLSLVAASPVWPDSASDRISVISDEYFKPFLLDALLHMPVHILD